MNRRIISVLATVGLAAGLVTASAGGAGAYPVGTALTLTARPNPVVVNHVLTATSTHAEPGCRVTFFLGTKTSFDYADSSGVAQAPIQAPPTPGPRTMMAIEGGTSQITGKACTSERAYTRVVVTGPVVVAPPVVHHNRVFKVTALRFPAYSILTIKLIHGRIVIVQHRRANSAGTVVMYFRVARTGTYLVTATVAHSYATRVLRVIW